MAILDELVIGKYDSTINITDTDRISQLPESLLHQILSLLPESEAARTIFLSKIWRRAWKSHPRIFNFSFCFPYSDYSSYDDDDGYLKSKTVDEGKRVLGFFNEILSVLSQRLHKVMFIEIFQLSLPLYVPESESHVSKILDLLTKHRVGEIEIHLAPQIQLTSKSYGYSFEFNYNYTPLPSNITDAKLLDGLNLEGFQFKEGMFKGAMFSSLKKLSLVDCAINPKTIYDLLACCPLLEIFHLHHYAREAFPSLKICGHSKLKKVSLKGFTKWVQISLPNLETLSIYLYYGGNIFKCPNLKTLKIACDCISNKMINEFTSKFRSLETLILDGRCCSKRIQIATHKLRGLALLFGGQPPLVNIEAPNLCWYKYVARELLHCGNCINSNSLSHVHLQFSFSRDIGPAWFLHLRENLAMFHQQVTVIVELMLNWTNMNHFDPAELGNFSSVPTPPQLECLKLVDVPEQIDYKALLDCLLWSCHPNYLTCNEVPLGVQPEFQHTHDEFIEFLCRELIYTTEESVVCCEEEQNFKCWRHYKKYAEIVDEKYDEIKISEGHHAKALSETNVDSHMKELIKFMLEWFF
ncbi:hypothetical protein L6164_002078 [Bauhinia variegata]|uniref:Uncharacterized protein n=1 Tax=Bauhinia variegata TaxID=167791 RepID=A0ACB9PYY3_BAUVA|nr:hypothetical protein L6164_002078 [Bauhinia variegata]